LVRADLPPHRFRCVGGYWDCMYEYPQERCKVCNEAFLVKHPFTHCLFLKGGRSANKFCKSANLRTYHIFFAICGLAICGPNYFCRLNKKNQRIHYFSLYKYKLKSGSGSETLLFFLQICRFADWDTKKICGFAG
jgi:hypothetical protein